MTGMKRYRKIKSSWNMISLVSQYAINKAVQFNEPLYILTFEHRDTKEIRNEFLNHSFKCDRIVICGGNAGMAHQSTFEGDIRGTRLCILGREWVLKSSKQVDDHIVAA